MNLDVRTMYVALAATCFVVAMGLYIFHAGRFQRDGSLPWTVGWIFQAAFWTLLGFRGVIWDFVSIVLANTLLSASYSLFYAAVRKFQGRAYNRKILFLPPAATFVFFWYFSAVADNVSYRAIFISLLSLLQTIALVRALFRDTPIHERRSGRLTGFAFLVTAGTWGIRLLEGFTLPHGQLSVLEATTFRNLSLIVTLGAVILASIAFVLMLQERAKEKLQKNEDRLKAIFDSVRAGILIIDPETHAIVDANPVAVEMIGASKGQIVGSIYHKYVCPAENKPSQVEDPGQRMDNAERVLLRADGREIPIIKTVNFASLGGRDYRIESFVDIAERKLAEEEKIHSEKLSTALEMAGAICHELNQPLQVISGRIDLLSMECTDDQTLKKLELIKGQISKVGTITKKLVGLKKYSTRHYIGTTKITKIDQTSEGDAQ